MSVEIKDIFQLAIEKSASDVLITTGAPPCIRVNGHLAFAKAPRLTQEETKQMVYSVLQAGQIAEFEREKELDFSFTFQAKHRFRGNAYLQREAVAAAFRLIPDQIPTLGELGLPPVVEDLTLRYQGLILITGPTGQGKSTTQAAMIEAINRTRRSHIITVEDPIEYLHQNQQSIVDQREVGPDTHSFAGALKHVLRQNPDVILVGEMRDIETVQAVLTAAETGHLVISTLHTNDAVQAVDRVLDIFSPHQQGQARSQLALSLLAVIAQRLVRKTDRTGRVLALEIMMNTPAVGNLIREGRVHQIYSIMETQAKEGMVTLDNSLKDLYLRGKIDKDEAKARMRDPSCLDRMG
jgi:twitching motility protein PilT